MLELTKYEARRLARGTLLLSVLLGIFAVMIVGLYPSIAEAGTDFEAYIESLPPSIREGFGIEAVSTLEGFLSTEFYQFIWLLMLGLYTAYLGGGTIAGDIERGGMDLLLATPISRSQVLLEKFLALLTPIISVNLIIPLFVYGGIIAIGESIDLTALIIVHLLSIPYLLTCSGIGVLLSVLLSRRDIAQRGGIAAIFILFLFETVSTDTDYEWIGWLSPTKYFDPTEILVKETYDIGGALILFAAAVGLIITSQFIFQTSDI